MAIQTGVDPSSGDLVVTFSVEGDPQMPVSVVGSFNDWTPGVSTLEPGDEGMLTVTVPVPADADVHFRYLRSGGVWFDDPEADEITEDGSIIRADRLRPAPGRDEARSDLAQAAEAARMNFAPLSQQTEPAMDADATAAGPETTKQHADA